MTYSRKSYIKENKNNYSSKVFSKLIWYAIFLTEILNMDFTKRQRSIQPFSRDRYQTILSIVQKTFNIPVSARTDEQRRGILHLQYYRAKYDFHFENGHLCFRGKRVLLKKELSKVVNTTFKKCIGLWS